MKIAILGSRGIPNQYGGFEQFAEAFSVRMAARGHEVYVLQSSLHPYQEKMYHGVHICSVYDAEAVLGTIGQFVFDWNGINACRKLQPDIILQLGYTSSIIWYWRLPKKHSLIFTNMDGLEWKRSKYSPMVQRFLRWAESLAVKSSYRLIADNQEIQSYLKENYQVDSDYVAYGADLFQAADEGSIYAEKLKPYTYNMLIARMEPENHVEEILQAHSKVQSSNLLLVFGAYENEYGKRCKHLYESEKIRFMGGCYDIGRLNQLRHFSDLYFHGHSVGGTNPSLLEAMASQALIIAHNNAFNRAVLGQDSFYFASVNELQALLEQKPEKAAYQHWILNNEEKISKHYNWEVITNQLEHIFQQSLQHAGS
jgi:glycosyltransferase involved in cell wall biosynthesis